MLMEARAAPRLRNVEGLWRRSTRTRPGSMATFIRSEGLLDAAEIDAIVAEAPADLLDFQLIAAAIPLAERPPIGSWLERFHAGLSRLAT